MRVVFNSSTTASPSTDALGVMRRMIAAAFGGISACSVSTETALLCGALVQKAYLGLEMAELSLQTWNIVGLAIASRTLVETAAMVCALTTDPGQANKMLANPRMAGVSKIEYLKTGYPAFDMGSWDLAMSLAHPSPKAYQLMVACADFTAGTDTKLLGRWDSRSAAALQRLSCDAGMRTFQAVVSMTRSPLNEVFAAEVDRFRREAALPSNLEADIKSGIESLSQSALSLLLKCQGADVNRLKSERERIRLFGMQYSVQCTVGAAHYLQFPNPDAFMALCRSWMEAGAVMRVFARSELSAAEFLRKNRITWAHKDVVGALSDRLPQAVDWYKEAAAYPHASLLSLRPRLLVNEAKRCVFSVLSPAWDPTRLKIWLPRALALAAAAEHGL